MSNRFNITMPQADVRNPFDVPPKASDVFNPFDAPSKASDIFKDELNKFDKIAVPDMASLAPENKPMEELTRGQAWDLIEKKMTEAEAIVAECQRIANFHGLELEKELVSAEERRSHEWNNSGCSF